jgi:cytoskeletal protein CcmA (bactofilin family)
MMFSKPKRTEQVPEQQAAFDTVIGAGCRVQGDVVIRGAGRILGEIEGSVRASGDLEVDLGGTVKGDVRAERAWVTGKIEGDVRVRDSVELRKGSHLRGDVYAKSFRIQDGAVFQGNCHMGRDEPAGSVDLKPETKTETR